MVGLPFFALKLLFTRPKLFALATFPGVFTFALSSVATYLGWELLLQGYTLWLSVPLMMMIFLLSWLLIGNISLIPVEDPIADECQKAYWGELRLPAARMSFRRIFRELGYSLLLAAAGVFFFLVTFLPVFGWFSFLLAAWITAYGFLSPLYARKEERISGRVKLFFGNAASNFALGFVINFLLFVPILNVFLLGYAQILATLLFLRRESAGRPLA